MLWKLTSEEKYRGLNFFHVWVIATVFKKEENGLNYNPNVKEEKVKQKATLRLAKQSNLNSVR